MSKAITLDGQIIHGLDRFGLWRVTSIDGWKETPPEKSNSEARPLADGDFDAEVFYGSRLVTVNGRLSATSPEMALMASERLSSLLRIPALFSVDHFGMMRSGMARRGRIAPGKIKGRHLPFQMELRFIDPYKYGEKHTETGSPGSPASLFHRGTTAAWPVVTISGASASGYLLTLNGRTVTVTRALVSGSPHTLDFRTGILRVGGAVARGGIGTADFGPIPPGLPRLMTTNAGAISVTYHDTFI